MTAAWACWSTSSPPTSPRPSRRSATSCTRPASTSAGSTSAKASLATPRSGRRALPQVRLQRRPTQGAFADHHGVPRCFLRVPGHHALEVMRMYGVTRAVATLVGAAAAGFLLWLGTQVFDVQLQATGSSEDYWAFVGLAAAAGLVLALSQIAGGWTKWGLPRVSLPVLVLGFLPALVVGGLVLLASQPSGGWGRGEANDLVNTLGVDGLAHDLGMVFPAIALGLGLLLGLVFDTAGSRRVLVARDDERAADEPTTAERAGAYDGARE